MLLCRRRPASSPTLLFHGAPGTGKTHAAAAFAGALGRNLATASLAQIHNKYVGETEKHLEQLFQEAARAKAVLLLDEADALLHSREHAQRSYEVSWVNVLLKLLEKPASPVILCTNFVDKLDSAVHRRIHYVLAFPVPGAEERRGIWARELRLAGLCEEVDLDQLAGISLSGGLIANAVRQAKVRKALLRRSFKLTTSVLEGLAYAELPKMEGARVQAPRIAGFGA
jgi:SpoVK/Ycf46/Vps4 family AAA+-type ATPase